MLRLGSFLGAYSIVYVAAHGRLQIPILLLPLLGPCHPLCYCSSLDASVRLALQPLLVAPFGHLLLFWILAKCLITALLRYSLFVDWLWLVGWLPFEHCVSTRCVRKTRAESFSCPCSYDFQTLGSRKCSKMILDVSRCIKYLCDPLCPSPLL